MDEELTTQEVVPETKASTAGTQVPPPDPPPPRTIAVADGESREIPDIGDAAVQAAFEKMLDEAEPDERAAMLDAWDTAEMYGEQRAFVAAVKSGMDAVLELNESLDADGTAGRRFVRDLLEEIENGAMEKGKDPWEAGDHVLMHAGLIRYGGGEEILRLLSKSEQVEVVRTIHEHEDELWGLFENPPDPADMLRAGSLNDVADAVWLAVGQVVDVLLEHQGEIDFVLDDAVPAAAKEALHAVAEFANELTEYETSLARLPGRFLRSMKTTSRSKRDTLLDEIINTLRKARAKPDEMSDADRANLDEALTAMEGIRARPPILLQDDEVLESDAATLGANVPSVALSEILSWDPPPEYNEVKWRRLFGRRTRLTAADILDIKLDFEDRWWLVTRQPFFTEQQLRLLAADLAERALPVYERAYPEDDRPRRAIEAARSFGRGEIDAGAMHTAGGMAGIAWSEASEGPAKDAAEAAAFAAVSPDGPTAARGAWQKAGHAVHLDIMTRMSPTDPEYLVIAMNGREDEAEWQLAQARKYLRGEA